MSPVLSPLTTTTVCVCVCVCAEAVCNLGVVDLGRDHQSQASAALCCNQAVGNLSHRTHPN